MVGYCSGKHGMDPNKDQDIALIIKGCRKGNRNSQNLLYRAFYAYGMSICIRYANSENEAISILNDGFLKVFKHIKKYDPERSFKPWFRQIVVNTAINHVTRQKKFRREVNMEEANKIPSGEDILSMISYRELMEVVQSLSLVYRTVFNMYVIDGFKHEEIAQKLGISESTSKSNLSRARKRLQFLISQKLGQHYV
ncbi:MAG: RNA polymerase sigma factor [Bacteroidia bacterium]